jgi:glutamine synthetase
MKERKTSIGDVLRRITDEKIEFVDMKFVDVFGGLQHITFSADAVDEGMFRRGINFDGSSVRGFQAIHESDLLLRPDAGSVFADPFFDDPTLSLFCDIVDPNGFKPYRRDPRGVAKRAEKALRGLGIADVSYFGLELEFYLFDEVRFDQAAQHGFYFLDTEAAFWNTGGSGKAGSANRGHRAGRKSAYFAAPPIDESHNMRSKLTKMLRLVGVTPELHHHEVGAAGQNEIGIRFASLTRAADDAIKFKYTIKNTADRFGKTATFMPKPLFEEAGSGMHTNLSLWKDGKNAFYEDGRYADLSPLATHFIGGILKHAKALCALCAPSTSSYRRLVPGYEAPVNLVYSSRNRSACIRVPFTGTNPKTKRIEFRTPDPSANPYLSCAAVLMAGIDGVVNEIEPPAPVDQNIYEYAHSELGRHLESVPPSLEHALAELEADHEFLLREGVFSPDLVETWLQTKREKDVKYIALRPHPSEFSLYFDC